MSGRERLIAALALSYGLSVLWGFYGGEPAAFVVAPAAFLLALAAALKKESAR